MAGSQEVTFEAVAWSDQAADDLTLIADVTPRDLAVFQERIEADDFQLLEIQYQKERVGVLIWSVDKDPDGVSLVINAAAAKSVLGLCLLDEIIDRFRALGREVGARSLRCWTQREGMRLKLEKVGAKRRYVMELKL